MGVDELHMGKKLKSLTVVSNLETREPLWFEWERKKEASDEYFRSELSGRRRRGIEAACVGHAGILPVEFLSSGRRIAVTSDRAIPAGNCASFAGRSRSAVIVYGATLIRTSLKNGTVSTGLGDSAFRIHSSTPARHSPLLQSASNRCNSGSSSTHAPACANAVRSARSRKMPSCPTGFRKSSSRSFHHERKYSIVSHSGFFAAGEPYLPSTSAAPLLTGTMGLIKCSMASRSNAGLIA
ncbi:MAG: transposase [Acidobacteria bacterium]|nr:transposase [Acidobacteriota bacterium]MBI3280488.1 transposase [Acidobacteriota bacterium]